MNVVHGAAFKGYANRSPIPSSGLGLIPHAHITLGVSAQEGNKRELVSDYQDRVSVSNAAKQLHLHIKGNGEKKDAERSWERIAIEFDNEKIELMNKHISIAGNILERMKKLAENAQDETISKADRIELQIEMGRLQHSLDFNNDLMEATLNYDSASYALSLVNDKHGIYEDSDAYKMLTRTRERIANGEEWDVAEINTTIYKYRKDSKSGIAKPHYADNIWEISDDETIPSVGDILKAKGRSVMDAEAAAFTAEELKKDLTKLAAKRETLIDFVSQNSKGPENEQEIAAFEKKLFLITNDIDGFLQSLFREMVQTTATQDEDEQGDLVVWGSHPKHLENGQGDSLIIKDSTEETLKLEGYSIYA
ncbi:MAG: hypothetical protein LBS45_08320 [Synergistaceae bacterium]|jgi:hypothetical protein|nr:hypothetical protein [Synergistaceae bacterium]